MSEDRIVFRHVDHMMDVCSRLTGARVRDRNMMAAPVGSEVCEACGKVLDAAAVRLYDADGERIGSAGPECAKKIRKALGIVTPKKPRKKKLTLGRIV